MAALLAKVLAIAVIVHAPCPSDPARDCAEAPRTIYFVPGMLVAAGTSDRDALNHELGHLVDYNLLSNSDRGMFEALMHMRRPWVDPPNSPHEQFAEAFRLCARSTRWPPSGGGAYGYRPTRWQHRKVCRWLISVGARP